MDKPTAIPDVASRQDALRLLETIDALNDDTKDLALNLALCLAKAKSKTGAEQLKRLEPEFVRLVNGTIKVVQEITVIIKAAKNREIMVFELPTGEIARDHIELKLEAVAAQCNRILDSLTQERNIKV
jgi:thioredoxin-like negative regulator of GroEL